MTRDLAARFAKVLIGHAITDRYPTRSVEYMLAWMMMAWSFTLAMPGQILVGPTYQFLTALMPESGWAALGIVTASARLFALIRNGSWYKSPYLRLAGACVGFNFWLLLAVLYGLAFHNGAPLFPMYGCLPVFMFFEVYSAYRCGQDAQENADKRKANA
jgi:hypothetical protein